MQGEPAVATYRFSVRYELDGRVSEEQGREILVFARRGEQWLAVWRAQLPVAQ